MFAPWLLAAVLALPPRGPNRPLVVLLHGDAQKPDALFRAFETEAKARDVGLIAPECPIAEGCKERSFWKWNGDPAWLRGQAVESARAFASDPRRIAYVGWSGGASYLGYRFHELGPVHSAVVFLGGGMAPSSSACSPQASAVLLVVGDRNPLHALAKDLRSALEGCHASVTWSLLPGADHAGEWHAITSVAQQHAIFDFVLGHSGVTPDASVVAGSPSASADAASPSSSVVAPSSATAAPALIHPTRSHVGCMLLGEGADSLLIAAIIVAGLRRRKR
jgi:predicted esterase